MQIAELLTQKKMFPILAVVFLFFQFSSGAYAEVWPSKNTWSLEFEAKYAKWITEKVEIGSLKKWNIATDCADVAIALRWIFARENFLPVLHNTNDGWMISNESNTWDSLPGSNDWQSDQRFQAALRAALKTTSTATVLQDSYPVKIQEGSVAAGAFYLRRYQGHGHLDLLARVGASSKSWPITIFASTVPAAVRELTAIPFMRSEIPKLGQDGIFKFRWPVKFKGRLRLLNSSEMPDYSQEQFSAELSDRYNSFDQWVFAKMKFQTVDAETRLFKLIDSLIMRFHIRKDLIHAGIQHCNFKHLCLENSADFENYSTYSRDMAIGYLVQALDQVVFLNRNSGEASRLQSALIEAEGATLFSIEDRSFTLGDLVGIWQREDFSSDPNVSEIRRWSK